MIVEKYNTLGFLFSPKHITVDFELAIHKPIENVWPNTTIIGCRFNLTQSWWRNIQKCDLLSDCPVNDKLLTNYCDYLTDTYISECLFPPSIWASNTSELIKTTNAKCFPKCVYKNLVEKCYLIFLGEKRRGQKAKGHFWANGICPLYASIRLTDRFQPESFFVHNARYETIKDEKDPIIMLEDSSFFIAIDASNFLQITSGDSRTCKNSRVADFYNQKEVRGNYQEGFIGKRRVVKFHKINRQIFILIHPRPYENYTKYKGRIGEVRETLPVHLENYIRIMFALYFEMWMSCAPTCRFRCWRLIFWPNNILSFCFAFPVRLMIMQAVYYHVGNPPVMDCRPREMYTLFNRPLFIIIDYPFLENRSNAINLLRNELFNLKKKNHNDWFNSFREHITQSHTVKSLSFKFLPKQ
ncbi:hypothetical protein AGLY_006339 [Aphis glycines]|uniref:Uncharacterized protein n=1 Tax=Aphis glycines TaxID=307491 RepID=A0A6G0TR93_APHGL|nr:hypothetical protein AGLY_006339 [Aphis glycines]